MSAYSMNRSAPPFSFFFLHTCTAWPIGVIALALGSSLVRAGVSVRDASQIIAVTSLAFTFGFVWAPLVDASLTRKLWYLAGSIVMGACLAAVLVAPWNVASVGTLTVLALASSVGAAVAAVAVKGIMAYEVPVARLGAASGFYTAGGTFAKAVGGAGTLWLITHLSSRVWAAAFSLSAAAIAAGAIGLASPSRSLGLGDCPAKVRSAITELWAFARTRKGFFIALVCVVPFGAGAESGLLGAISHEWGVSPDQLASIATASAATNVAGAMFGGWLSARVGPLKPT
jgi:PAT family beta-lactamase induction signal transducer AmpG